jgi:uncharacterized protein YdhG (YjbR/CyaY superfamily)
MAEKKKAKPKGFTPEEKEAMREHVRELKRQRTSAGKEDDERAVLEKIAAMPQPDRSMAERIHALVKASAPELSARLWYGMPAYTKDDKVICFFQNAQKFKTRYSTFGFQDKATLDEGNMWPIGFALKQLSAADEARIADLLKRATR